MQLFLLPGIAINPAHTGFKVLREVKDVIYLNPTEVDMVWNYDGDARWRKYQDMCVFGNLTGLRVSDIKGSDFRIEDGLLVGRNTKTQSDYYIPLATDDRVEILLKRYDFNMFLVSEQKYNKYIKELLGIIYKRHNIHQRTITIVNYQWREKVKSYPFKQDLISNHSSRRGFITNMYNVHRYSVEEIQAMIGSTSSEILKYLKVEQQSIKEKAEAKRMERLQSARALALVLANS